ncbi:Chemotaxis protein methyltransferase CheR [Paramagnetospirillum magnetotacticum MS-1]|uniref:Chemotaxis protein methyltransferase CheR n=1 Tax=Paramagnetospirillum magnetotacticum MS-1 TaxID=272627 RepID=A0A0C2YKJ1_PARME|nr:protein-glutamate O-methyltransferase CheR [Paramagnetospirillum magnetotacticum]KIM00310.1 Chemotaxis protein methyltransferase CheR [Paramagnetospirillum magnetotacticum MS-1]
MNAAELSPFKTLIRTRCGLLLEGVGEEPLVIAIKKRMTVTGIATSAAYLAKLGKAEDEFQEFVTLLTINETYFYREPEQLILLVERLMPKLLADETARLPITILSAGCSSGEEPYSIAMALLEKFGEAASRMVRILGGDIDHHALARARAGRYTAFSFRSLTPQLRQRYFRSAGRDAMVVDDRVKAMVSFHHLNLMAESFPPALGNLDVVFFRNVSIYFDESTRRTIQQSFHRAMSPRGHLVIGSAETLANDLGIFRLVEDEGDFYFVKGETVAAPAKRPAAGPAAPVFAKPRLVLTPPPRPIPQPESPPPAATGISVEEARTLIRDKQFDRVELLLGARNRLSPPDATLLALEGYARLMTRDFAGAADLGAKALAADEWSADSLVLLGLAAKWQDQGPDAMGWFKKAVYAHPECWPAHYYLGDLYRAMGSADLARRSYRVVLQQLASQPDADGGLALPLGLPLGEIQFLCERHTAPARSVGR